MAELISTEPALSDLDTIADYIALDNPEAARDFVWRIFRHVEQLAKYPLSGSRPKELRTSRYRQIVEPPCPFSIATMESEPLFCTSCAGRCGCAGVGSSRETCGAGRPKK